MKEYEKYLISKRTLRRGNLEKLKEQMRPKVDQYTAFIRAQVAVNSEMLADGRTYEQTLL